MNYYNLWLPVFKQGDDLSEHINECANVYEAFLALAERYKSAAEICEMVAVTIKEIKNLEIDADTHHIGFHTNSRKIQKLVDQNILIKEVFE